jgi:PAS domain S-box-containing protein
MMPMLTESLLTIINRNADGILVIDQEGTIRFCNPSAEALFGRRNDGLVGTFFGFPLVAGETAEIDILRGGIPTTVEMRAVAIEWQGESAFLASMRDVTERKLAQDAIALRNRAIESSASGIMIIDATIAGDNRPLMYVNPAFERITGYSVAEVLGRSVHFLYDCNPDLEMNVQLDVALREGEDITCAVQCQRKDGTVYWSELHFSPLRDESGRLTHIVGVQHDITDRKFREAEQIETARIRTSLEKEREMRTLKERFLTMMSHELRTPLALIRLSHDMLRQYGDVSTPDERQQFLDNINVQVLHLTDLVADVLTVSRAERMAEEFSPEVADLITFCRTIVEEYDLTYHRTHPITFACSARILRAPIDKRLLRHALTNLLGNAIKYSPHGGVIEFGLQAAGRQARITIADQGIGISKEDIQRLFEPFHRGGNVETIQGTGLGLAIVNEAIKAHGGSISVESTVGQGSTFTIKIPMVAVNG